MNLAQDFDCAQTGNIQKIECENILADLFYI